LKIKSKIFIISYYTMQTRSYLELIITGILEIMTERERNILSIFRRKKPSTGNFFDDETTPLLPVQTFNNLLGDIDLIKINAVEGYNDPTGVTSLDMKALKFKGLSRKLKEFLEISEHSTDEHSLKLTFFHEGTDDTWVALTSDNKRFKVLFDVDKRTCMAITQKKVGESWKIMPEIIHPLPDVVKIVQLAKKTVFN